MIDRFSALFKGLFFTAFATIVLFNAGRLYFFFDFAPDDFFNNAETGDILYTFLLSLRFDFSVVAMFLIIPLIIIYIVSILRVIPLTPINRILNLYYCLFVCFTIMMIIVSHYYFYYYKDHFNIFFWEFWQNWENAKLVIWSVFDEIPIFSVFTATCCAGVIFLGLVKFIRPLIFNMIDSSFVKNKLLLILWLPIFLVAIRGTFDPLPLGLQRYRGQISPNSHLNFVHANSYYSLYFSYLESGSDLEDKRITEIINIPDTQIKSYFNSIGDLDNRWTAMLPEDSKNYHISYQIEQHRNYLKRKPKHIVFFLLESETEWILKIQEKQFSKRIAGNFLHLKRNGIYFENCFQIGAGTSANFYMTMLGVPVIRNFLLEGGNLAMNKKLPYTMARVMERNGYKPKLFYGGSLTWHRLYNVASRAGFTELYGENHMPNVPKTRFGVYDEHLYEYLHKVIKASDQPSFNFIMTLSNHPPFNFPENFKLDPPISIPDSLTARIRDMRGFKGRVMAFAYADQSLGQYFKLAQKEPYFKETLYIFAADHAHDFGLEWNDSERFWQKQIPILFYAPHLFNIPPQVIENPGTQMDILPSIISLIDDDRSIHSWGRSLFSKQPNRTFFNFWFDCTDDICTYDGKPYRILSNSDFVKCSDQICMEKFKKISELSNAYYKSGMHYLLQYPAID